MRSTQNALLDFEEHWSTALDTYRVHPTSRHRRRFVIRSLRRRNFNRDTFMFDYGCGPGIILEDIKNTFNLADGQLGGCDISCEAIKQVRARFDSPHFFCSSYPDLDRPIDVAICTEVIEHTREYKDVLQWIAFHVRPGGTFVLTAPGVPMDPPDRYYGHVQHFELDTLTAILRDLDFEVEHACLWGFPLFSLQKFITKHHFERIKNGFMTGSISVKKKLFFGLAYRMYFIHDLIPRGPQIFIRAKAAA